MQVRALRQFNGAEGMVRPRQVLDVDDRRAKELMSRGLVEPATAGKKMVGATASNKMDASPTTKASPDAAANPTPASPSGGRTGATKSSSSSAPVRRRKK